MREQKFDFVIYPLKLIITVGLDYETLCNRFENMEPDHKGEWGDKDDMDKEASFSNLVRDRDDDDKFAILWKVIIYQFTPVHFDASQPRPTPATPRPLPGSPPVTYFIGLEDSVFLTQISLYS